MVLCIQTIEDEEKLKKLEEEEEEREKEPTGAQEEKVEVLESGSLSNYDLLD